MPVTQPRVESWWGQKQKKSQVVARQGRLPNTLWLCGEDEGIPSRGGHEAKGVEAGMGLGHWDIRQQADLSLQVSDLLGPERLRPDRSCRGVSSGRTVGSPLSCTLRQQDRLSGGSPSPKAHLHTVSLEASEEVT